ncbi:MAG: DNA repair exonuclease, partial [Desulfovibrio sp.]|nr:DNA repair exonuclease [Desulfovibrio sp.]
MKALRYVHAANLHLDAPFCDLTHSMVQEEGLAEKVHAASFQALQRLEKLCLEQKPDFVLLTGDTALHGTNSIPAQLAFRHFCEALNAAEIQIFIARSQQDSLDGTSPSLDLPDNVLLFTETYQKVLFSKEGEPHAVIHGISTKGTESDFCQAGLFQRDNNHENCFQLGLFACALQEERNLPSSCSRNDLEKANLDAWALGQSSNPIIYSENSPLILDPGNLTGL